MWLIKWVARKRHMFGIGINYSAHLNVRWCDCSVIQQNCACSIALAAPHQRIVGNQQRSASNKFHPLVIAFNMQGLGFASCNVDLANVEQLLVA